MARARGSAVAVGAEWWLPPTDQSSRWFPQGVHVLPDRVLLTSYLHGEDGKNHGSRVTEVDRATGRHRHVPLLGADGAPLRIHAGGIAVLDDRAYVAATRKGLAVLDATTYAFQRWEKPAGDLRYSFCSATPDGRLVVGEYDRHEPGALWCGEPDGSTGRWWTGAPRMQGAVHDGREWWITASRGRLGRGWLLGPRSRRLPAGPEDLAWDPDGRHFWTVTEYAWRRRLLRVPVVERGR